MDITKFTEDNNMGCNYGCDLINGIYLKVWVVDESLGKHTKILEYNNMDHYLVFNKKSTDKLTPKQMQSTLDQYGFNKMGELNMGIVEKHYTHVLEVQNRVPEGGRL